MMSWIQPPESILLKLPLHQTEQELQSVQYLRQYTYIYCYSITPHKATIMYIDTA